MEAGYTLNKEFCLDFFPDVAEVEKREAQYDARYQCFQDLELMYDHTDEIDPENGLKGIPIFRDRDYCEILHIEDSNKKFECIEQIAMPGQEEALNDACVGSDDLECKDNISRALRELGIFQEIGADFCEMNFLWEDEYSEKFDCLV